MVISGYRPLYSNTACTSLTRQKRDNNPVVVYCWVSVADEGSILTQHWVNVSFLL